MTYDISNKSAPTGILNLLGNISSIHSYTTRDLQHPKNSTTKGQELKYKNNVFLELEQNNGMG